MSSSVRSTSSPPAPTRASRKSPLAGHSFGPRSSSEFSKRILTSNRDGSVRDSARARRASARPNSSPPRLQQSWIPSCSGTHATGPPRICWPCRALRRALARRAPGRRWRASRPVPAADRGTGPGVLRAVPAGDQGVDGGQGSSARRAVLRADDLNDRRSALAGDPLRGQALQRVEDRQDQHDRGCGAGELPRRHSPQKGHLLGPEDEHVVP